MRIESLETREVLSAAGWSIAIGGLADDIAYDVSIDSSGNAFVGGYVDGQDGYTNSRAFIAKYDSAGNQIWNRTVKNNADGDSAVEHLEVDKTGDAFAVGWFTGEFEFDNGVTLRANDADGSIYDGFLAKFDTNGTLQWIHQYSDYSSDLAIHTDSNSTTRIYLTGDNAQDFVFDGSVILQNNLGHVASYLVEIVDLGVAGSVSWQTQVQDSGRIRTSSLSVNSSGEIYLSGEFNEGGSRRTDIYEIASIGGEILISGGSYDPFVAKFSSTGNVDWTFHIGGGKQAESGNEVAIDSNGDVYVAGTYLGGAIGGVNLESVGGRNTYIAKITDSVFGPEIAWVKIIGGYHDGYATSRTHPWALSIEERASSLSASLYLSGYFSGTTDFDPDPNQEQFVSAASPNNQGFLLRLTSDGEYENVWQFGESGRGHASSGDQTVVVSGSFDDESTAMATEDLDAAGGRDGFLIRLDTAAPDLYVVPNEGLTENASVAFDVTVNDINDGDLSGLVDWTLDGVLYAAKTSHIEIDNLAVGTHTLGASVVDSDGVLGSYTRTFDVIPAAPTNLNAVVSGSSVTLTWNDHSSGETGFVIERALQPNRKETAVWEQVGEVGMNETIFVDASVESETYIYRIRAVHELTEGNILCSAWSAELEVSLTDSNGGRGKPRK